jgi:FtsP/CotA-like multicopper oxidase with cupredoxin domain
MNRSTVDEWIVASCRTPRRHPFHIHVNPFQIIRINGVPPEPGKKIFGDTLIVEKDQPESAPFILTNGRRIQKYYQQGSIKSARLGR